MIGIEGYTSCSLIHIYMDGFGGFDRATSPPVLCTMNSTPTRQPFL